MCVSMPLPTNYRLFTSLFRVAKCPASSALLWSSHHKYYLYIAFCKWLYSCYVIFVVNKFELNKHHKPRGLFALHTMVINYVTSLLLRLFVLVKSWKNPHKNLCDNGFDNDYIFSTFFLPPKVITIGHCVNRTAVDLKHVPWLG